ncbi:MAG: hypothetical protein H6810_10500 [Phycisphaeraceae bacterium]|nr:MAG: hypothetical protein H6810_10500 [Phycisphaeraceae bacterium]
MKAIWNIITVMALANLIAIVGFVWWLHFSGRLDTDRFEQVRTMFSETIAQQQARETADEAAAKADAEQKADEKRMEIPPITASDALSMRIETSDIDRERIRLLERQVRDLTETLSRERRKLDADRAAFEKERDDFQAMRDRLAAIEGDAQFAKSVGVLSKMKAADAKQTLSQLLPNDREQVVSYLDAMQERTRTDIISQFVKDGQADLAAGLLEDIRVRGLEAAGQ